MKRIFIILTALCLVSQSALAVDGTINNYTQSFKYGVSAGLDQFNIDATYALGVGNDGIHLPATDIVVVSFDGGKFSQTIPTASFVPITGGYKFTSTNPGISLMKIMNDGTLLIQARKIDLTGVDATHLQSFSLSIGDDTFSHLPNSMPIAKISSEKSAQVGNSVSLSGAPSSDFENSALTYSWSIVSKPLGSAAELGSINTEGSSISLDKAGFYAIKLSVNDGVQDGIPAIITIEATGGAIDPPPPLGSNNGFIQLSTDMPSYIVGDVATLSMVVSVMPGNGTDEYFYDAKLDNAPMEFSPTTTTGTFTYTTSAFSEVGAHALEVNLFIQNRDLAKQLNNTISYYQNDILLINAALQNETDPEIIAVLNAQKANDLEFIAKAQEELLLNRTAIGSPAILNFQVN